jgi:hypothetical protein
MRAKKLSTIGWQKPARVTQLDGGELLTKSCNRWANFRQPKFEDWQVFARKMFRRLHTAELIGQIQEPTILLT